MTVMLYQQINDSTGTNGTGTIIEYKNKYFLLTAAHVAKELKNTSKIIFRINNDQPAVIDLVSLNQKMNWQFHQIADIAIMELIPYNLDIKNRFINSSFPSTLISDEKTLLWKEFELTFLGYPVTDLILEHFSALSFKSNYASGLITQTFSYYGKNKKCSVFYLDKSSIQGASGSGLYLSISKMVEIGALDRTILVGIVSGTHSDNTGGKLAIIMPSFYIWDLLKLN